MEKSELIVNLKSGTNPETRWEAAAELGALGAYDDEVLEALAQGLLDIDSGVKDICARTLSEIPKEYGRPASRFIAPLISNKSIEIRNLSSDILIKIGAAANEFMIPFFSDPDYQVRQFACDVVGRIADPSGLESVYTLLDDSNPNVINSAIEAIGNIRSESSFEVLASLYGRVEDLKPGLMEAIGKIGSTESEDFLIDKLKNEEDVFMQTAAIDALAFCGKDIGLCNHLLDELGSTPAELQPILLKTIFAIASRNDLEIELPPDLRHVAVKALFDDDNDIVGAGLIALGFTYNTSDVPGLVNVVLKNGPDMQQHILAVLLTYSDTTAIREFFDVYFMNSSFDEDLSEFLSYIKIVWEDVPEENAHATIETILDISYTSPRANKLDITEIMLQLNPEIVFNKLRHYLEEEPELTGEVLDIVAGLRLDEFRNDIEIIAGSDSAFSEKAAETLEYLN